MSIANSIKNQSPLVKSVQRIRHSSRHSVQIAISICVSLMLALGCTSTKNSKSIVENFLGAAPQNSANNNSNVAQSTYSSSNNQQTRSPQIGSDVQNVSYEENEASSRNAAWNQSDSVKQGSRIESEFPVNVQDASLEQPFDETKSGRIPIGGNDLSDSFLSQRNAGRNAEPPKFNGRETQKTLIRGFWVKCFRHPRTKRNRKRCPEDAGSRITNHDSNGWPHGPYPTGITCLSPWMKPFA